jgi:hypothetical protein
MDSNARPNLSKVNLINPPVAPPRFSSEDGLEIWNRLVFWKNNKIPLERLKNKGSVKTIGLLKRCNGITDQIRILWNKKKINETDWRKAINKYIAEIINRDPSHDYCNHRFSMLEFIKQSNGFDKYLNR